MSRADPPSQWSKLPALDDVVALELYAHDLVQRIAEGEPDRTVKSRRDWAVLPIPRNVRKKLRALMGLRP